MFACQPANTAISYQQSAIRERKYNTFRTSGPCSKVIHRSSCPVEEATPGQLTKDRVNIDDYDDDDDYD